MSEQNYTIVENTGETEKPKGPPPAPMPASASVNSVSDERTVNNVMRHEYKVLSEDEKLYMQQIKDLGAEFYGFVDRLYMASEGGSRELSIAKTKIEEAVMWAVKHITK